MKNKILFTAVLAAMALNGCNKQADVSIPPASAPAPATTTALPAPAPAPATGGNAPVYAPASNPQPYVAASDTGNYSSPPGEYPAADIGVEVADYPQLEQVPGYPVYYAPSVNSNYFFYDGMYWDYQGDNWYASSWYNGPWQVVAPDVVPLFVLRVPVRYYRHPPAYFRGWREDAPPQWGVHYGRAWEDHHRGWDQWNRNAVPAPAPLPAYQREYSRGKYPQPAQQQTLHQQNYHYQPRDTAVEHVYHEETARKAALPQRPAQPPAPPPQERNPREFEKGRPGAPPIVQPNEPAAQRPEPGRREETMQKGAPPQAQRPVEARPAPPPVPQPAREPQREPQQKGPPERATPAPHEQPAARPVQERPLARPPQPEARPAPQQHEQPIARPAAPPPREQPHEQPAPRPVPQPPHEQPAARPAPPPHEQPVAHPAPPQPKPAPPREEKKEEERK